MLEGWKAKLEARYNWSLLSKKQKIRVLFFGKMSKDAIFFFVLFMVFIAYSSWSYKQDMATCYEHIKHPCDYCQAQLKDAAGWIAGQNTSTNFSNISETIPGDPFAWIKKP